MALLASQLVLGQNTSDAGVKARVALAVARFAELPGGENSAGPLRLCLVWNEAIPQPFRDLTRYKIGARQLEVITDAPFLDCDVIYVHESVADWRRVLAVPRSAALTVGDCVGFLAAGGMIELVIENDAVRFDVNLKALRQQGIRLSPQVLKLARRVQE